MKENYSSLPVVISMISLPDAMKIDILVHPAAFSHLTRPPKSPLMEPFKEINQDDKGFLDKRIVDFRALNQTL